MKHIRAFVTVVLAAHGLIHLIGFVVPWRIATLDGFAYRTTAFGGQLSLGETGAQILGLAWLAVAVGFLVAATGIWRAAPWAVPMAGLLAVASLAVCVLGLPETSAGIVVNLALLVGIAAVALRPGRSAARVA